MKIKLNKDIVATIVSYCGEDNEKISLDDQNFYKNEVFNLKYIKSSNGISHFDFITGEIISLKDEDFEILDSRADII